MTTLHLSRPGTSGRRGVPGKEGRCHSVPPSEWTFGERHPRPRPDPTPRTPRVVPPLPRGDKLPPLVQLSALPLVRPPPPSPALPVPPPSAVAPRSPVLRPRPAPPRPRRPFHHPLCCPSVVVSLVEPTPGCTRRLCPWSESRVTLDTPRTRSGLESRQDLWKRAPTPTVPVWSISVFVLVL